MNYRQFILDSEGNPQPQPDLLAWVRYWQSHEELIRVAVTQIGPALVSTVFLRTDHNFGFEGGPVFWETLIFGGKLDEKCVRCGGTREQAEAMHCDWVAKVMKAEGVVPVD